MGPDDDDDFEEHEPLPDPTLRAWRHPSELAAVAAMAADDGQGPPRRRRVAVGSLLLGTALGAIAVLGVLASTGLVGGEPSDSRFDLRDAATTEAGTAADGQGGSTGAGGSGTGSAGGSAGDTTTSSAEPSTSATTTTTTSRPTTTSGAVVTTTVATTAPPAGPLAALEGVDDELAVADLTVPPEAVIGVAVGAGEVDRPRCTGLALDDVVLTSASAIGKATEVTLVVAGTAYPATVVGRDRFTDIAVIEPHVDTPLSPLSPSGQVGPDAAVALVATDGRPEPITVAGRITGWDQAGVASDGHDLIGLVSTSARLPEPGAGSLLLTSGGALVGMVVDTPGHLAMAVPEATLRAVSRSLRDTGHAVPVWLGVSVVEATGGVSVQSVTAGGPAASAGLRAADVLVSIDGVALGDLGSFFAAVRSREPGDPMTITVDRGGQRVELRAVLGSPPGSEPPTPDEQAAD